tara:strand:- start:9818 stop:10483 length:666 start_codon:yes stop_codon:yes gene_type:complete
MFKIIIQLTILIYIIFVVYNLINLQKFNINGVIIETIDINDIKINSDLLNPVLTNDNNIDFDINNINGYSQDINNYKNDYANYVSKNKDLFEKLLKKEEVFNCNIFNDSHYYFPIQYSLSIISGSNSIPLKKCIHNKNIIGILDGDVTIYLFNPKHKDEIVNKDNNMIKKWGHKKILQKGDILIIPPYWSYIQEINNKVIQYHIDVDTYFTFIPNYIKDNY